jgi:N-formylglutamate deformylase
MLNMTFDIPKVSLPFLTTAVHEGHDVRDEVRDHMYIDEKTRYREEDPYTGILTAISPNRIINWISRFEVDVNRSCEKAIYRNPEDAWGLKVWKENVPEPIFNGSMEIYNTFYRRLYRHLKRIIDVNGYVLVYDIHSYNYRRKDEDDPVDNPEVNIGTGKMNRDQWGPVVDQFIRILSNYDFYGRNLDVRENIKFRGGYMAEWIHKNFKAQAVVLPIELKKFFMDEFSGEVDLGQLFELKNALSSTISPVLMETRRITETVLSIDEDSTQK